MEGEVALLHTGENGEGRIVIIFWEAWGESIGFAAELLNNEKVDEELLIEVELLLLFEGVVLLVMLMLEMDEHWELLEVEQSLVLEVVDKESTGEKLGTRVELSWLWDFFRDFRFVHFFFQSSFKFIVVFLELWNFCLENFGIRRNVFNFLL